MSQRGLSSHADESLGSDVCNSIAAPGKGRGSGCSDLWPHGQGLRPLMPRCNATEFWCFLLFSLPFSLDLLPRSGRKRVRAPQKIFFLLHFLALQPGWAPLFSSLLCYHSVLKLVLRKKCLYIVLFQIVLATLSLNSSTSLDQTYTKLQLSVAETLQKTQFIFHPQKGSFQRHKTLLCNRFRIDFFWCVSWSVEGLLRVWVFFGGDHQQCHKILNFFFIYIYFCQPNSSLFVARWFADVPAAATLGHESPVSRGKPVVRAAYAEFLSNIYLLIYLMLNTRTSCFPCQM